jgi:hypothetical protein
VLCAALLDACRPVVRVPVRLSANDECRLGADCGDGRSCMVFNSFDSGQRRKCVIPCEAPALSCPEGFRCAGPESDGASGSRCVAQGESASGLPFHSRWDRDAGAWQQERVDLHADVPGSVEPRPNPKAASPSRAVAEWFCSKEVPSHGAFIGAENELVGVRATCAEGRLLELAASGIPSCVELGESYLLTFRLPNEYPGTITIEEQLIDLCGRKGAPARLGRDELLLERADGGLRVLRVLKSVTY